MERKIAIGDSVKYVDPQGKTFNALVKQQWGSHGAEVQYEDGKAPAINLVYVSDVATKTDGGGRQTEVETSVSHRSMAAGCPGRFWYQD